jgi:biopolymer transport protein TolR
MAFSGNGSSNAEINITPLIDILLVLIITFMVVVSMSQDKGLKAEIPQPASKTSIPMPERTIIIQLEPGLGQQETLLKINEENVSWLQLEPRLREIFSPRLEKVAFVTADPQISFQPVADLIDVVRRAGVDHVGLLIQPAKQEARLHQRGATVRCKLCVSRREV